VTVIEIVKNIVLQQRAIFPVSYSLHDRLISGRW